MADNGKDQNNDQQPSGSDQQRTPGDRDNDEADKAPLEPSVGSLISRSSDESSSSDDDKGTPYTVDSLNSASEVSGKKSVMFNRPSVESISSSSSGGIYKFHNTRGKSVDAGVGKAEAFIYMTVPPDGGYGWIILCVAFYCQVVADGILLSVGILLPHIGEELDLSYKQTAVIASAQLGIYCFAAPVSGAFINRYGFRAVAVLGAVISSISILIATYSQGLLMLFVFYGVIAGPAMGMIWMSTTIIINYYFEKYRAAVGGLASSGSGVGVILISMLNSNVVDSIGWRNTARIHVLLLWVAGLLTLAYRDVKPIKVGHVIGYTSEDDTEDSDRSVEIMSNYYSSYILPITELGKKGNDASSKNLESRLSRLPNVEVELEDRPFINHICPWCARRRVSATTDGKRYLIKHDPLERQDIFYDGRPDYNRTGEIDLSKMKEVEIIPGKEKRARSINYSLSVIRPPAQASPYEKEDSCLHQKVRDAFHTLFDLNLLRLAEFRLMLLESFFFLMGFNIPFVYGAARAEVSQEIKNLLPVIIGCANVCCRIFVGFVAYKIELHPAYLSGIGMLTAGLMTLVSGFVGQSSEVFQLLFACAFGLGAASYGALRAIIYVKALGLGRLTNAIGLSTMVMGIGVFIGTNVAGIMNDSLGGYWSSFIFSGTCMTIAGCLKLILPEYLKYRAAIDAKKATKKVRFSEVKKKRKVQPIA